MTLVTLTNFQVVPVVRMAIALTPVVFVTKVQLYPAVRVAGFAACAVNNIPVEFAPMLRALATFNCPAMISAVESAVIDCVPTLIFVLVKRPRGVPNALIAPPYTMSLKK